MKKIVSILLCLAIVTGLAVMMIGCTPRDQLLKIYMPGDYIDEEFFGDFEAWYLEETGNKIKVRVEPFDAVENIKTAVEGSQADFDLLCPSDYMVEYLIKKGLVRKLSEGVMDASLFKSQYIDSTREFDPNLEYAVPYMYGTLGLVYDRSKTNKDIDSWEALFGSEFAGHRSLKDSMRDAYAAACIYNARNELIGLTDEAQKAKIQSIFEDTSANTISQAQTALRAVVDGGAEWDVDNVKFEMAADKSDVAVALMWSCDAGYVMNEYEDANGKPHEGNRNLWYVVPNEGGNVYIDAFVINKYAVNVTAAEYFLKYLCRKDVAIQNSEYAGCISPVAAAYDELYNRYMNNEGGIFDGTDPGWKEMFIETMFPSDATLNRCGVMKDFGSGLTAVTDMWSNISAGE